jgi:SSS family solute:Na+ symporter
MNDRRQALIDVLEHEFRANTSFVRIHAAEALIEHGFGFKVSASLQAEADTASSPYRIGVWRALARIAESESRRQYFSGRLRRVLCDPDASDRLHAAESLDKLGLADRSDRPVIEKWLASADDASSDFPLWLLVLSSELTERARDEARLAKLLESKDPVARLRSAFALGRLETASAASIARLSKQDAAEPEDSPARVYLLAAAYLHAPPGSAAEAVLKRRLLASLGTGKPNEQFEAATVIGLRGSADDLLALAPQLRSTEADDRIGAANASLHVLP